MSGVLVYCITDHPEDGASPGPDLAGAAGDPVEVAEAAGLSLWTEPARRPVEPTRSAILAHHSVVVRAWQTRTSCLPLRFGQWFPSPGDALEAVEERTGSLLEALERVRDGVEYGLEVELKGREDSADRQESPAKGEAMRDADPALEGGPGTAYLEELRRRHARSSEREKRWKQALRRVENRVRDLVRDRQPETSTPNGVAHLLARSVEEAYVGRLRMAGTEEAHLRIHLKGPWPPWSFGA